MPYRKTNWLFLNGEIRSRILLLASVIIILSIFASILATPFIVSKWSTISSLSNDSGLFGDQFGMTNALFSGLALAAVAITLYLQTRELKEQRKENDDTQEILKGQEHQAAKQAALMEQQLKQLQLQGAAIAKQNFDSAFFNLYSVFRDTRTASNRDLKSVLSMIDDHIHSTLGHIVARETAGCFGLSVVNARHSLITNHSDQIDANCVPKSEYEYRYLCAMSFYWLYENIINDFGPYLRSLQSVLLHVEMNSESKIPLHMSLDDPDLSNHDRLIMHEIHGEALKYSSIVNSVITQNEMLFLAFAIDHPSHSTLRRLINRYELFRDFQTEEYQYRYIAMPKFMSDSIQLQPTRYDE